VPGWFPCEPQATLGLFYALMLKITRRYVMEQKSKRDVYKELDELINSLTKEETEKLVKILTLAWLIRKDIKKS
jgi:hypothetical protein